MKGFLITLKGMEDIASLEVKELIGKNPKIQESCISFEIKKYYELFELCYKSQSAIGIYYHLYEFNYTNIYNDFKKDIDKIIFNEWLNKNTQFRVKCIKNFDKGISSPEIEKKLGEIVIEHIQKKYNYKQKVNLEDPEIIILFYLTEKKCYVGIDFAGFDLSKRSYKIFSNPADIKGIIGYFLVRLSNTNKKGIILDCFSGSGTIPIEAAIFTSNFPINYFNKEKFIFLKFNKFKNFNFNSFFDKLDKNIMNQSLKIYNMDSSMKNINSAKRNSKIAGVDKKINYSRHDIGWLDTKFNKGKLEGIITKLPSINQKNIGNIYNEFFYQSEFILNKKGNLVLIGNNELIRKYSSKYNFKLTNQMEIFSGKMKYDVFVLNL